VRDDCLREWERQAKLKQDAEAAGDVEVKVEREDNGEKQTKPGKDKFEADEGGCGGATLDAKPEDQ